MRGGEKTLQFLVNKLLYFIDGVR